MCVQRAVMTTSIVCACQHDAWMVSTPHREGDVVHRLRAGGRADDPQQHRRVLTKRKWVGV